jgi:hypothetical protein
MLFKMEVLLRQMAPQDAIWLVMVKVPRLAEVVIVWIYILIAEVPALLGPAPHYLGSRHQMESTSCPPILHQSRVRAVRV